MKSQEGGGKDPQLSTMIEQKGEGGEIKELE